MMMQRAVGLDFGTSNSAIAVATRDRKVELARFGAGDAASRTMRSVLHFHPSDRSGPGGLQPRVGADAIARYLANEGEGRLLQSIKSHIASRTFTSTNILGRTCSIEDLLAFFLRGLRAGGEASLGPLGDRVVVGRPVRFAGADEAGGAELAMTRLRSALAMVGFKDVCFEYEPVAAAYHYEARLDHDELALIADFGGGTSDFSLVRVGPSRLRLDRPADAIVGSEGIPVAGDALDGEIIREVVAPMLGMESHYRSIHGQLLPVPVWLFVHLRHWHHLSLLKSRATLALMRDVRASSLERHKIDALIHLVDCDLGFQLFRAVEALKLRLSNESRGTLSFRDPPIEIEQSVSRDDFESWTGDKVAQIAECVNRLLGGAGVGSRDVDRVFMTGGTSLVPAVREMIEQRFGADRIAAGEELTSVAQGLALRALDP